MKINFTKMHGLGNDFIVLDGRFLHDIDYKKFAAKYCERNFGIGADGVIILEKSKIADFKMLIYNADGSRAQVCGNGLRCLAKYVYDKNLSKYSNLSRHLPKPLPQVGRRKKRNVISIETGAGIKTAKLFIRNNKINFIEISLGKPIFNIKLTRLKIKNKTFKINCVSMGNPHCVIFSSIISPFAQDIANHSVFPQKTNVEFIEIVNKSHINVFVYERGAGPTLACGTGAAAAAVVSILTKNLNRKLKVSLPGGDLFVRWDKNNNEVYLKGPAETTFEGAIYNLWECRRSAISSSDASR